MSVPKLKVYRLNSGYSSANDDDIQYLNNDELLPVSTKVLNPWNTEVMIGVESKSDAHIVEEINENYYVDLPLSTTSQLSYETIECFCDNWILGKENIYVYVRKDLKAGESSSSTDSTPTSRDDLYENDGWYRVNPKYFRFFLSKAKIYYNNNGYTEIISEATNFTTVNKISIELGQLLFNDATFWSEGDYNTTYNPIEVVRIGYRKYKEFDNSSNEYFYETSSEKILRVPFDEIYNGNKTGRKISTNSGEGLYDDNPKLNNGNPSYLEGNYTYKKSIYPLRFKLARMKNSTNISNYIEDVEFESNGSSCSFSFIGNQNWIIDGNEKYYIAEIRPSFITSIDSENNIVLTKDENNIVFSRLNEGEQINQIQLEFKEDGTTIFKLTFIPDYYKKSLGEYLFPTEVVIFYNEKDDRLGNIFDFDYNYYDTTNKNTGKIIKNLSLNNDFNSIYSNETQGFFLKKKDLIAVRKEYANLKNNEILTDKYLELITSTDELNVTLNFPLVLTLNNETNNVSLKDMLGNEGRIYLGTDIIFENGVKTDKATELGITEITRTINDDYWTFSLTVEQKENLPKELMFVYWEKKTIGNEIIIKTDNNGNEIRENPWCIGYRVPCYQKSKETNLFVSSHPNWVKDHLNNNVDVFFGNTFYSGTDTNENGTDGIYPFYQEQGTYSVLYTEGAINFNSKLSIMDYDDIRNFASSINPDIVINNDTLDDDLKIYYQKVRANYAYYDGIYNVLRARMSLYSTQEGRFKYALLEDDYYNESGNKRIVLRSDSYIRNFYESGIVQLPEVRSNLSNEPEICSKLIEINLQNNQYLRINTSSDRCSVVNYVSGNYQYNGVIVLNKFLNENPKITTYSELLSEDVLIHINISESNYLKIKHKYTNEIKTITKQEYETNYKSLFYWEKLENTKNNVLKIGLPTIARNDTNNYFKYESVEEWNELPDLNNIRDEEDVTINKVHNEISKWTYTNEYWNYDVIFEIYSYRYDVEGNLYSIEFVIYKVDKES